MGTRINLLLGHDLTDFRDSVEVLARLAPTTKAAVAVRDYWLTEEAKIPHDPQITWEAEPVTPRLSGLRRFSGPGSLFLSVAASAACVRTGGRWRGFLAVESLRRVHLLAFRLIARALGSDLMAIYGDSDEIDELIWAGRPPWECVEQMEQLWGPPYDRVDDLEPDIAAAAELYLPSSVWFLEGVLGGIDPEPNIGPAAPAGDSPAS